MCLAEYFVLFIAWVFVVALLIGCGDLLIVLLYWMHLLLYFVICFLTVLYVTFVGCRLFWWFVCWFLLLSICFVEYLLLCDCLSIVRACLIASSLVFVG